MSSKYLSCNSAYILAYFMPPSSFFLCLFCNTYHILTRIVHFRSKIIYRSVTIFSKISLTSWLLLHLIWKKYVLDWESDSKKNYFTNILLLCITSNLVISDYNVIWWEITLCIFFIIIWLPTSLWHFCKKWVKN